MKIYRYMSLKELSLLSSGMELNNDNNFRKCRTISEGFCFLGEREFGEGFAYYFLSGIVSGDVVVEFEVDESLLTESMGTYADPFGGWYDTIDVVEYYAKSYSKETFKPLRYGVFNSYNYCSIDWYVFH